jgi:hypothetical protein
MIIKTIYKGGSLAITGRDLMLEFILKIHVTAVMSRDIRKFIASDGNKSLLGRLVTEPQRPPRTTISLLVPKAGRIYFQIRMGFTNETPDVRIKVVREIVRNITKSISAILY